MNKRLRIKEINGEFFPQKRILGLWFYYHDHNLGGWGATNRDFSKSFKTLKEAREWLDELEGKIHTPSQEGK